MKNSNLLKYSIFHSRNNSFLSLLVNKRKSEIQKSAIVASLPSICCLLETLLKMYLFEKCINSHISIFYFYFLSSKCVMKSQDQHEYKYCTMKKNKNILKRNGYKGSDWSKIATGKMISGKKNSKMPYKMKNISKLLKNRDRE